MRLTLSTDHSRRLEQIANLPPEERRQILQLVDAFIERGTEPVSERNPAQKQIERLNRLHKAQQKVVMQLLDGVLSQSNR
jgi:hypothetical protein